MKKKMIVLIAFIYIASMLFCGDGVGKKFVEEKFPHLTYSDKECDDSKKKELRIVEDEDTAGGILSYEELAAMENENASVKIGRASCRERVSCLCRSRWSPYH